MKAPRKRLHERDRIRGTVGFNGAAVKAPRKPAWVLNLYSAKTGFNGAAVKAPRKQKAERIEARNLYALQWSRGEGTAETCTVTLPTRAAPVLQWSRGEGTAETRAVHVICRAS